MSLIRRNSHGFFNSSPPPHPLPSFRRHASRWLHVRARPSPPLLRQAPRLGPIHVFGCHELAKGRYPEYYAALVAHDRALLHGRGLADGYPDLTFDGGNETFRLTAFGFLHYAEVDLGTPNVTFLVALDTGSDLFWVPCDCTKCAPTTDDYYNMTFSIFNSSKSSTCSKVPCSSSSCESQSSCADAKANCPFQVQYLDNSSTSGVLLEDVLHLITDDHQSKPVQARVTFGCGHNQPSTFDGGTPNGLLGLGLERNSVPSTLTALNLAANSFSMCFSQDGHGRIRFGDKGSPDQDTTPFYPNIPTYIVTVNVMIVDNESINAGFRAYFDTGTSFTLLADPAYSLLTKTFHNLVQKQRVSIGNSLPLEYCYKVGPNEEILYPNISLIMKGGREFPVIRPVLVFGDSISDRPVAFCLGIIKSSDVNIIGQNFMTGYKVVFDRDKLVLGWKEFDCYSNKETITSASRTRSPALEPPGETNRSSGSPEDSGRHGGGWFSQSSTIIRQTLLSSMILSQFLLFMLFPL